LSKHEQYADYACVDDETTIKVASKKESKQKASGNIKLKKPVPKYVSPGNWQDGNLLDGGSP